MSDHSTSSRPLPLTFLLGGVRAGKSAQALQLAHKHASESINGSVLFVATAQAFDDEMIQRIAAHRAERPPHWSTLEEPIEIAGSIARHLASSPATAVVVIDCLTLWVSNILLSCSERDNVEAIAAQRTHALLSLIQAKSANTTAAIRKPIHWIIVSNEVGLGIVPPTLMGRQYRDALGRANQLVAAAASEVTLLVAGLEMPLKVRAAS